MCYNSNHISNIPSKYVIERSLISCIPIHPQRRGFECRCILAYDVVVSQNPLSLDYNL